MGKKRDYDDDDGRVIADMSGLEMGIPKKQRQDHRKEIQMTKEERRFYILGALKAGLLVALAFLVGLGLVVGLLLLLWK